MITADDFLLIKLTIIFLLFCFIFLWIDRHEK